MVKIIWTKFQNNQISKFVFVGLLNTIVGYVVFSLLIFLNQHYFFALSVSSIVGVTHSYFWNKYFTFKTPRKSLKEFLRFVSVYMFIYVFNLFLLYIFVDILKTGAIISQGIILTCVTLSSFLGHKYWSFK